MRLSNFIRLAAVPTITIPYLTKLHEVAKGPEFAAAAPVIERLIRNLKDEYSGLTAFPVEELWDYLKKRDVPEDEISILKTIKVPRASGAKPLEDAWKLRKALEEACGKSLIEGVDWDHPTPLLIKNVKAWTKGFHGLKRYHWAESLHQKLTKKVKLVPRGHGTEDASWLPGSILSLSNLATQQGLTPKTATSHLVHELGHAFEELFDMSEYYKIYGADHPPFVSEYGSKNVSEDFAETFRAFEMEPSLLRSKTPVKYADMARRIEEKLS